MNARIAKAVRQSATLLVTLLVVVAGILWLSNFFGQKIPAVAHAAEPGNLPGATPLPRDAPLYTVVLEDVPQYRSAIGSVEAVHTADIGTKLMAQVKAVTVTAGKEVKEGDILVQLDDTDLQAQAMQAQAQLDQARAAAERAQWDFDRQSKLVNTGSITEQEFLHTRTNRDRASAAVVQAEQALKYAENTLSWTVLRSPINGVVVDKLVEAGDLVKPGQSLVRVYNRDKMQLVASVPEMLASSLSPGQNVNVKLDVLPKVCVGTVSEIVPEAAAQSRTFQVKVTGPCPPGVYSGMFGRLLIPIGTDKQIRIPVSAVRTYGQLQQVMVSDGKTARRRFVSLGDTIGDQAIVLSGLTPGEKIVANYGASSMRGCASVTPQFARSAVPAGLTTEQTTDVLFGFGRPRTCVLGYFLPCFRH
jgi:RND family efflux transporter MFP subunit